MILDLICCAENCLIDVRSNRMTLVNVYDGMSFSGFPATIGPISTVLTFRRDLGEPENIQGVVRFLVDDDQIFEGPYDADFQGSLETRVVADMARMVIPHAGLMTVRALQGATVIGEYQFSIGAIEPNGDRLV